MSSATEFCDWDAAQRMQSSLHVAANRNARAQPQSASQTRSTTVANSATLHEARAEPPSSGVVEPTVVVDVTDKDGVHRSITMRPSDSSIDLAQRYAQSVPGGISEKQFQKLLTILSETAAQHFGR